VRWLGSRGLFGSGLRLVFLHRRRRVVIAFLDKLILGCFCLSGFELSAG
jgi:hypothetical protein